MASKLSASSGTLVMLRNCSQTVRGITGAEMMVNKEGEIDHGAMSGGSCFML